MRCDSDQCYRTKNQVHQDNSVQVPNTCSISLPVCSLLSSSLRNSWLGPQPHAAADSEEQSGLESACIFLPWNQELDHPKEWGYSGLPWREGRNVKFLLLTLSFVRRLLTHRKIDIQTRVLTNLMHGTIKPLWSFILPKMKILPAYNSLHNELQKSVVRLKKYLTNHVFLWFYSHCPYYHFFSRWLPRAL